MAKNALPPRLQRRIKTFYAEARPAGRRRRFEEAVGRAWRGRLPGSRRPPLHQPPPSAALLLTGLLAAPPRPPRQVWIRQHETKEETVLFQARPPASQGLGCLAALVGRGPWCAAGATRPLAPPQHSRSARPRPPPPPPLPPQELPHALRNEVAWHACKPIFRCVVR